MRHFRKRWITGDSWKLHPGSFFTAAFSKEVDIPTNPDFDGQEVADDEIQSGMMLCMQMMLRIATDENACAFWDEFQKQPVKFSEGK